MSEVTADLDYQYIEELRRRVADRAEGSARAHRESSALLPMVATGTLKMSHPVYVRSARGARVTDVDGNEYIDLTMGFGPHILGHAPELVIDAVAEALGRGLQFALHHPDQLPLAELIVAAHPANEKVLFCNTGTEATLHAIRLARAFSGKAKIAVFEGSYHGAHDSVMATADPESPAEAPTFGARGAGVPPELLGLTVMLPYWHEAAFEMIRAHRDELAVVLVEPVQGSNPQSEQGAWLRELAEVCAEAGVLLLFDEVISGFRLGYGGGQERFGIAADLTTYGKVLGGGMPVGAITGRREIVDLFAADAERYVFSTGTFSGNPIGVIAGAAVLQHLRSHPEAYTYLEEQSRRLADGINGYCLEHDLPAQVLSAGSVQFIRMQKERGPIRTVRDAVRSALDPEVAEALQLDLLSRGVVLPGVHQFHLSTAHTPDDVDHVIVSCQAALQGLRRHGWL